MKITIDITPERISDLLCCALEGGSNYWYMIDEFVVPTETEPAKWAFRSDTNTVFRHLDYPLNDGGALIFSVIDDDSDEFKEQKLRLDLTTIQKGLELMAQQNPLQFGYFLAENEDATTGDVFLQLCLFGQEIFG
jgi:hypothetical protein